MSEVLNLQNYQFTVYSLPVFVSSLVILAIGSFILYHNIRSTSNVSFFLLCLSVSIWLSGFGVVYLTQEARVALIWYKYYTFFGVVHIAPSIYFFVVSWLGLLTWQKAFVVLSYLSGFLFYFAAWSDSRVVIFMQRYFWGYYPRYGLIGCLLFAIFVTLFVVSFFNFLFVFRREPSQVKKKQMRLIFIGFIVSFVGGLDFLPKIFSLSLYPFGYLPAAGWISVVAYSIVKYRFMGIETVVHKTILWFVTSASILIPLLGLVYLSQQWLSTSHPLLIALSVLGVFFLFMFYVTAMQPRIDRFFQRRRHALEKELVTFNDTLVHLRTLDDLGAYVVRTIEQSLYANGVRIFLCQKTNGDFLPLRNGEGPGLTFSTSDSFLKWLEAQDRVIVFDYLEWDPRFRGIQRETRSFFTRAEAKVGVPLVLNERLVGFILLGDKKTLKPYTNAEITYLSELRRSATIALSNSLALIEMQESLRRWNEELEAKVKQRTAELERAQAQLIQAEKLATIGTLAGGVAHEINNPLTAILTNAQLLQAAGGNSDDLESLQLIEEGAKRCQSIIQKLMKYARKSEAEEVRSELDINTVIENALAFIRYQLEQDNIAVTKNLLPVTKIKGNAGELEQVFTNILLNARDAIKTVKSSGQVAIQTYEENGSVCARIQDDGVGMELGQLSKIFDPFFTTKDVGKGTGLGLSISYGIIEKHGGKILVSSKPGEGCTFTVVLPASQSLR